jgi:hypothetical protein
MLASVITLLALPTIWLANRDEGGPSSSRPNVAVVGIDPGEADQGPPDSEEDAFDPMGDSDARYLEPGTTVVPPDSVAVVVGTSPDEQVATARGTYRRAVPNGTCLFNGVRGGERVTIVNVANGRTVECTTSTFETAEPDVLVMSTAMFRRIADLTAAPIHVEVRQ